MKVEYSDAERRPVKKKRKKKHSKINGIIMAIISILLVLGLAVTLMCTVLFNVSSVEVIGSSVYSSEQVINVSGIMNGDNLFLMPSKKIEAQIIKSLPYIKEAEIIKSFPNSVSIRVEPVEEKFIFINDTEKYVIDNDYKVLRTVNDYTDGLIRIKGVKTEAFYEGVKVEFTDKQQRDVLSDILTICEEKGLNLTYINIENLVDISFAIDDKKLVKIGTYSSLSDKMLHLKESLHKMDPDIEASIDYSINKKEAIVKYEDIADFIK